MFHSEYYPKLRLPMYILWVLFVASILGQERKLVWEDEFDGDKVDTKKWTFDLEDGCQIDNCGWGNGELEWYQEENAEVKDGQLHIVVKNEDVGGKKYTSARMTTKQKGDWKFGRVEVKAKLPKGQAIWPAIWMLPTDNVYGDWPRSGAIDITEEKGQTPQTVAMIGQYGNQQNDKSQKETEFTLPSGTFADDFHVFAIEWKENQIDWLIDDVVQQTLVSEDVTKEGFTYPFNEKFFLILNVAVGGEYVGDPDSGTVLPVTMEVEYVKVYE